MLEQEVMEPKGEEAMHVFLKECVNCHGLESQDDVSQIDRAQNRQNGVINISIAFLYVAILWSGYAEDIV